MNKTLQKIYSISAVLALLISMIISALEIVLLVLGYLFGMAGFNSTILTVSGAVFLITYLMFYFGKYTGLFEKG